MTTETRINIESISILGRYREELGDLRPLAADIQRRGLLDPLILTPEMRVIGGERCLAALRLIDRQHARVLVVDGLREATRLLVGRGKSFVKPMTATEKAALGIELERFDDPAASLRRQRWAAAGGAGRRSPEVDGWPGAAFLIAEAFGMARSTYQRLRAIWLTAQDVNLPEGVRYVARHELSRLGTGGGILDAYATVRDARIQAGIPMRVERPREQGAPASSPPAAPTAERGLDHDRGQGVELGEAEEAAPKVRRPSLPAQFDKHTMSIVNALGALERLQADNRWTAHRKKLAPSTRHELLAAVARITAIAENLPSEEDSRKEPTA